MTKDEMKLIAEIAAQVIKVNNEQPKNDSDMTILAKKELDDRMQSNAYALNSNNIADLSRKHAELLQQELNDPSKITAEYNGDVVQIVPYTSPIEDVNKPCKILYPHSICLGVAGAFVQYTWKYPGDTQKVYAMHAKQIHEDFTKRMIQQSGSVIREVKERGKKNFFQTQN